MSLISFYSSPSLSSVTLLRNVWRCEFPGSELNTQNWNDARRICFPFLGNILLLYSVPTLSSTNRQVYTSFDHPPETFFFCSLIRFLKPPSNLFLWFMILNFSSLIVLFITGRFFFSRIIYIYIYILSDLNFSIQMSLDTFACCLNFSFHFISFDWRMAWQWQVG